MTIGGDTQPGHMRQRSRYACGPCRQRKRKCDGRFPCSTCTGYGYECQYTSGNAQQQDSSRNINQSSKAGTKRTALTAGLDETAPSPSQQSRPAPAPSTPNPNSHLHGFGDNLTKAAYSNKHTASPSQTGSMVPSKCRYMSPHSATAFPQWVGKYSQSGNPPRVHSFAYNTGLRKELPYSVNFELKQYITWAEVHDLLDIYSSVINPVFGFIDMGDIRQRSHDHWHGKEQGPHFEALISGVIALASLFSKLLCEARELRVFQHAKDILDDSFTVRFPRLDTISACILRTIYTRSTTRPGSAWLYSCITMHFCEAIGVHRDVGIQPDKTAMHQQQQRSIKTSRDIKTRVGMAARCLHIVISYEHGRSMVDMGPNIPEHNIIRRPGDFSLQLNALVNNLPLDIDRSQDLPLRKQELSIAITNLVTAPTDHEFFSLIKADLCFCIYRRLRLLDLGIGQEQLTQIIQVGKAALPAARILILRNHPWWNAVGSVFQYICVLLAIDSSESLSIIPEAMETLETITKHLKTHLAEEALHTAKFLVRSMTEKKKKEASILEKTMANVVTTTTFPSSQMNIDAHKRTAVQSDEQSKEETNYERGDDSLSYAAHSTTTETVSNEMNAGDGGENNAFASQPEWSTGLLDFMDPIWNWDAFFEPPLVSS